MSNLERLPLVNVTAQVKDQSGRPIAGALVKMRLSTPEKFQGIVVPNEVSKTTDANGNAVLRVFPNALGYEGSEYCVHISFPGSTGGGCGQAHTPCGQYGSPPVMKSIRATVVVPNSDCNLFDIMNLPPYEQRGAGALLPEEVAGYAAQAASAAQTAFSHAATAQSAEAMVAASAQASAASATASAASAKEAKVCADSVKAESDALTNAICTFTTSVTQQVEKKAATLTASATACVKQQEASSLQAIEKRSHQVMCEITEAGATIKQDTVKAVTEAGGKALHAIADAAGKATEDLHEVAGQYEEDFLNLTERAETAAKRAGCSAASASNEATRACACADRAETAAKGIDIYNDAAKKAATRAETAAICATASAQKAHAAADSVALNAEVAKASACAAKTSADAADESAETAKDAAKVVLDAKNAVAEDRAYVEAVADDVMQAVLEAATDIVTEEIIDEATAKATAEANAAKDAAEAAKAGAEAAKTGAEAAKTNAESIRDAAEAARDAAAQSAQLAKNKADIATDVVQNLNLNIQKAVPKPVWDGTKLSFTNDDKSITIPSVDVQGAKGDAATVTVGTVTALAPGTTPIVENSGTSAAAVFNFSIPRGDKGEKGDDGDKGDKGDDGPQPPLTDDFTQAVVGTALSSAGAMALNAKLETVRERAASIFSPSGLYLANLY